MDGGSAPLGVVHYGLGPIGLEVASLVNQRTSVRSVGAIDIRPELAGRPLSELIGPTEAPVVVVAEASALLGTLEGAVVAHCTGSSIRGVAPQLLECVEAGLSVVSTCEELAYPWHDAVAADSLDQAARRRGVSVVGCGVNPGFAMDLLPIALSGASRRVDHVLVHRVQEAGGRRQSLQRKIGVRLDVATFEQGVRAGSVGHIGLPQSAQIISKAFGWTLTDLLTTIHPITATVPTPSALGDIAPGWVTGVRQVATGFIEGREVLSLVLEMAVGLDEARDEIHLSGDPDVVMLIPGGLQGDVATAAVVVNALPRIVESEPGLRIITDLAVPHAWATRRPPRTQVSRANAEPGLETRSPATHADPGPDREAEVR